jgi:pyridoxal phosphate enzyme (YggS family)
MAGPADLSGHPATSALPAITEAIAAVEERIAAACRRAGRDRSSVTLVAVTKTHPPETLRAAWDLGLRIFGENRVQEAATKIPALPKETEWHLIGPLQSNKVRLALDLFRTIHSIDREKIALALDAEAARRGIVLDGFLEVNSGNEATKHGFPPETFLEVAPEFLRLKNLRIRGLMAIPPFGRAAEESRPYFRRLRELRDQLAAHPDATSFTGWLSMGMTDDFEVAIEEGATHVRIGTAIFGRR